MASRTFVYRKHLFALWALFLLSGSTIIAHALISAARAETTAADTATTPEELEREIQERTRKLETINKELETTQNTLHEIQGEKTSLTQELKTLDFSVKQLNLRIQADEVTTQKLNLELKGLQYDLEDIGASIEEKKVAIADLMRELQRSDQNNLLLLLLKNTRLTESLNEAQALGSIREQLTVDIANLRTLSGEYTDKLDTSTKKRNEVAVRQENLKNRKVIASDQKNERQSLLAQTKNRESEYQKKLSDLERQQEEIAKEIERFEEDLRSQIDYPGLPTPRPFVLEFPVPGGRLTQGYGKTSFAVANYRGKWHNGIDIGKFLGAEIIAAEDGTVVNMGDQDRFCRGGAYGKYIVIKHNNGLTTLYGHLAKQVVTAGQSVQRGQLIGYMGRTGYATGPHLHFVVYDTKTYVIKPSRFCGPMPIGGDIDPRQYVKV